MAGATEPFTPRTYRVGPWQVGPWQVGTHRVWARQVVAALTIGVGALLPFAQAASWDPTPLPPPPVQPVPQQTSRLRPGDVVALQVIPYRE
jgi:hypothetical protein